MQEKTFKKILIVTGGSINEELLLGHVSKGDYDCIIGVDKGLCSLNRMGIIPDIALGDFDSADDDISAVYKAKSDTIILNPMKDYTDTHMAVITALKYATEEIWILGATGTRLDHVMGNLALLKLCLDKGIKAYMEDDNNRIYMISDEIILSKERVYGKYVSLIPYSDKVTDIWLKGFLYGLEGETMIKDDTIGISNELREEEGHIKVGGGYLLVMETKD